MGNPILSAEDWKTYHATPTIGSIRHTLPRPAVPGIVNPAATVNAIEALLVDAAESVVLGLDSALTQALSDRAYDWPNRTVRSNGQTVSSPRDIIDTGELDSSQQLTRESRTVWRWDWTADHALIVHEGATLRNGTEIPARPWTKRGVEQYKPAAKFAQEVRRRV
jgi:hypothetical protein